MDEEQRRELEERDRAEAKEIPEDHEWPPPIDDPQLEKYFWQDPEKKLTGVLTADRIRAYHYAVGGMIRPFQEKNLNAASYDLTLGPRCVVDGEELDLDSTKRFLEIPPSSIAFVSSREELFIPHWLVATFNLKSKYIFNGLLMGAGPQVDPGFMGVLHCPLHNISSRPIRLQFCAPFAKLDFVKTTWGRGVDVEDIASEADFYKQGEAGDLRSRDGEVVKILPRPKSARASFGESDPGGAESSLRRLEDEFKSVRSRLRLISWSVAIGVLGLIIAGLPLFFDYTNARFEDVRNDNTAVVRSELDTALAHRLNQIKQTAQRTISDPSK